MRHRIFALTGGIGSGKSAVAKILTDLGFDVVNCDTLSREAALDPSLLSNVANLLGPQCVVDGQLNRQAVRDRIFTDEQLYTDYCALFWNKIKQLLVERLANLGAVVFVEIPVFDAFSFDWDGVWLVECAAQTQIDRVTVRDGVSADNVRDIMSKQRYNTFTRKICNNGTMSDLKTAVVAAIAAEKLHISKY